MTVWVLFIWMETMGGVAEPSVALAFPTQAKCERSADFRGGVCVKVFVPKAKE